MNTKITTGVVLFALLSIFSTHLVFAETKTAGISAIAFVPVKEIKVDNRAKALKAFLAQNNSPLANSAETFVKSADENDIDWKLVAAIAGLESGFGKHIPYNSYNAWGWGVYGDNVHYFTSWDDGVETISQGIRERYMNERGAKNVHEIGATYAASPTWAVRVEMFMNKIDAFYADFGNTNSSASLSLSL